MITDKTIIKAVLELSQQYPGLTIDGLAHVPGDRGRQDSIDAVLKDALHRPEHISKVLRWLRKRSRRKTFNLGNDTVGYKEEVEVSQGYWVSHMAMLVAVQIEGIEMKQNPRRPWAGVLKLGEVRL